MKCINYWPDNDKQLFGSVEVTMCAEDSFADFTVRRFSLTPVRECFCNFIHNSNVKINMPYF